MQREAIFRKTLEEEVPISGRAFIGSDYETFIGSERNAKRSVKKRWKKFHLIYNLFRKKLWVFKLILGLARTYGTSSKVLRITLKSDRLQLFKRIAGEPIATISPKNKIIRTHSNISNFFLDYKRKKL